MTKLEGLYFGDGLAMSSRSMAAQVDLIGVHSENIANYGIPGYHRKDPVVRRFADYLGHMGTEAVQPNISTEIGRLRQSGQPLDVALGKEGFFQKLDPQTGRVEMTRDGRFKLDKEGNLLSLDNKPILSNAGTKITMPSLPFDPEKEIGIGANGTILMKNPREGKVTTVATLGVVSGTGALVTDPEVKQGFVEDSNVFLQKEFTGLMPIRRHFEANRQLFLIQSDQLSRMVQELGRTQ